MGVFFDAWMLVGFYIPNICLFSCVYEREKGNVCVSVCERERARYGPTLTSGPHGLGFRAQNNLRLMFIYKHTPRRTRLRDLCPPPPPLPFFLSFILSLSLLSSCLTMFLLYPHLPYSSVAPLVQLFLIF